MRRNAQDAIWAHGPRPLAAALGCNDGAVYHWLGGKTNPRFDSAKKILEILNAGRKKPLPITVEDLMAPHEDGGQKVDHRKRDNKPRPTRPTKKATTHV